MSKSAGELLAEVLEGSARAFRASGAATQGYEFTITDAEGAKAYTKGRYTRDATPPPSEEEMAKLAAVLLEKEQTPEPQEDATKPSMFQSMMSGKKRGKRGQ